MQDGGGANCSRFSEGVCCIMITYEASIGNYQIPIFRLCVVAATALSILYLLIRLRPQQNAPGIPRSGTGTKPPTLWSSFFSISGGLHIAVYFNFVVLACLTFLFVIVIYILPGTAQGAWGDVLQVLYTITLIAQWFIQVSVNTFPQFDLIHCFLKKVGCSTLHA